MSLVAMVADPLAAPATPTMTTATVTSANTAMRTQLVISTTIIAAPCGLRGCKNRAHSVS